MALLRECLPLVPFLVILMACTTSAQRGSCQRVFPLQLTATAMPCRYICAFWDHRGTGYRIQGEDDGTPCRVRGSEGVCWYGVCLTRYGEQDEQFQHVDHASKTPRHIRKRDVAAVKGGMSFTKTDASDGGSNFSTKTVQTLTKTVKNNNGGDNTQSSGAKGFTENYMTSFSQKSGTKATEAQSNVDVNPFALKTGQSGSTATEGFFSGGGDNQHVSRNVKNGAVKITVHRGPGGEKITTRTIKRVIIRRGPTRTVSRVVIRHGPTGGTTGFIGNGIKGVKTHTITVNRAPTGGRNVLMPIGLAGLNRKTTKITTVKTITAPRNPLSAIVHAIKQERITGGKNTAGSSTTTKTVSTVAVTKKVQPSLPVIQLTNHRVTPSTSGLLESENTATLKGLEVEVPGYTAGLRHNWKWVLARRVGMYPPYVQVLDPDVLFYKLGLLKPNIPTLPVAVQNVLNRVPVHPVGSDLYGFLLSSRILEKIRGFTDGFNGLTRLKSMLSTTNASEIEDSNLLKSLFTTGQSSPSGSSILGKIVLASLSRSGNNPISSPLSDILNSPYGGLFGQPYAGPYGSPFASYPGGSFPATSWPLYGRGQTQFGSFGRSDSVYPGRSFGFYDTLSTARNPTDGHYTMTDDEEILPSDETSSSRKVENLLRNARYLKALLAPHGTGSHTTNRRYRFSHDEYPEGSREQLATILGRRKLRHLLNIPGGRDSVVRRIFRALNTEGSDVAPTSLNRAGGLRRKQLYKKIIYELLRRAHHKGLFGPSKFKTTYGTEFDGTEGVVSPLRYITGKPRDESTRYASEPRTETQILELLSRLGRGHRSSRYSPLYRLQQAIKHRQQEEGSRSAPDTSDVTEAIEDLLSSSGREPTSERDTEITKEITKALLNSGQGPVPTAGTGGTHLSKMVSVHGSSRAEARPQGLTEAHVISTTYHTNKRTGPTSIPLSPLTTSALEATRSLTQQSPPTALLGINDFPTAPSSPSPLQPYRQFVSQPAYSVEGAGISNQPALLNGQFVSSSGSVYGGPVGQPVSTMMTGAGGYTGYATYPTNTAYASRYTVQPYYIGTSVYGSHPHYIVEGHEAPGTRWQLKVWRHHPGVSYVAPSFTGFGSSHLGNVVTRARETVTRGLQLGTQPGHFGFTTFGQSVPGGSLVGTPSQGEVSGWAGATSQYIVKSPDGSLVISRQPLPYGSPSSGVVVSQTTKETTKTASSAPFPSATATLQTNSLPASFGGANSQGTATTIKYETVKQKYLTSGNIKSESQPELAQGKVASLFSELTSGSASESSASPTSTDGSSSSSTQTDNDLSQSKVRR